MQMQAGTPYQYCVWCVCVCACVCSVPYVCIHSCLLLICFEIHEFTFGLPVGSTCHDDDDGGGGDDY